MPFSSQIIRCAFANSPTLLLSNHPPTQPTNVIPDQTNNVIPNQTNNVIPDKAKNVIPDPGGCPINPDDSENLEDRSSGKAKGRRVAGATRRSFNTASDYHTEFAAGAYLSDSLPDPGSSHPIEPSALSSSAPQPPTCHLEQNKQRPGENKQRHPERSPHKRHPERSATERRISFNARPPIPANPQPSAPQPLSPCLPQPPNPQNVIPDSIRDPAIQSNPQLLSSSAPQPLSPSAPQHLSPSALLLHGYGGRKEDMLSIALALHREGIDCIIPDLPGHGENVSMFNIENVRALIGEIDNIIKSDKKVLLVGHSIGSVIALNTQASHVIALSPPGAGFFEGGNKDLLKILRARRVKEKKPYQGLQESISALATDRVTADCMLLYAKNELRSVTDHVERLQKEYAFTSIQIRDANHLDIVTSSEAIQSVKEYAKQHLL